MEIWVVDWFSITPDTVPVIKVLPFTCVPVEPDVLPEEISNGFSVVPRIVVVLGFTKTLLISVQLQLVITIMVGRFITTVYSPSARFVKDHDSLCVTDVVLTVSPLTVTRLIVIEVMEVSVVESICNTPDTVPVVTLLLLSCVPVLGLSKVP